MSQLRWLKCNSPINKAHSGSAFVFCSVFIRDIPPGEP